MKKANRYWGFQDTFKKWDFLSDGIATVDKGEVSRTGKDLRHKSSSYTLLFITAPFFLNFKCHKVFNVKSPHLCP